MADAFLSFALQKLDDFLGQQVSLRKNLRKEVEWLKTELLLIQSFLRDAEIKQYGDQRVLQWVFEINTIANDAVAILDTYNFEADKGDDDIFASRLKACACICRKEKKLYNVAEEIQPLKQPRLPSSIGNLKNLQTLFVNERGYSCELPRETADLINLRHFVVSYSKPLKCISKLTSLEVLKDVGCDQWKDVDPVDLDNLRDLTMHHINESYSLNNISSLKNLSTLRLSSEFGQSYRYQLYRNQFPSLEFVNCCEKLQKLWLRGRIEKLPLFPNSITMMLLRDSRLTEDPMPILGMLPNLRDLNLDRAYEGREIMCSDNSFGQLEFLRLHHLYNLERWHSGKSAMPLIKVLGIKYCTELREIPERMRNVKMLKHT